MLKIRLTQTGKRNSRQHRLIAIEEGKRRDGRALENLGFYNPLVTPPQVSVNHERVEYWVSRGAQLTPSAKKIIESTKS